jgi:DHA2 family multidrug resistance protein
VASDPNHIGKVTIPALWDKQTGTVVNNDPSEIIRMLNSESGAAASDCQGSFHFPQTWLARPRLSSRPASPILRGVQEPQWTSIMSDQAAPQARIVTAGPPASQMSPGQMSPSQTSRLLIGLGLATWMEFYTFDAVNLVLPDMAGSFGISRDEASWFLTTYSSALFLGVPLSIWLAGHLGHLRYIIGSAVLFVIASFGCATSHDVQTMLFWRAIEGFAGAGLTMWWRASVYLLIPRQNRSKSLMRISVMLYLGTAAGLLYSGTVTDNLSWRLIFLPNAIVVPAALWLLRRNFPDVPAGSGQRVAGVDKAGIALLAIAVISAQIVMSRGEIDDWFGSPQIQTLSWIAAGALLLFVGWQLSSRNAVRLLRLDLVRDRNMLAAILFGLFAGVILSGSIYALPEFLRQVDPRELNASDTGRVMCVYALTAAAIRPLVTWSIGKFGQRRVLSFALVMLIAAMLLMARLVTTGTPQLYFVVPLILYAFCLAPLLSAVAGGTVARLPSEAQLDAVSIYMTFRQFGAALGVTIVTVVLDWREEMHSSRLFEHLRATGSGLVQWLNTAASTITQRGGVSPAHAHEMALKLLGEASARQAATLAYADAFLFMAGIGFAALCLVPLMSPTPVVKK